MKADLRSIRKQRVFSVDFKRQLVGEFEGGQYSVSELSTLHGIKPGVIYRWIYKYSNFNKKGYRMIESSDSSSKKVAELRKQIKELEAQIGRKQIKIDFLEEMMEVAKEELNIDIKKNYNTSPSGGSKKSK